jgi:hypothetical protein
LAFKRKEEVNIGHLFAEYKRWIDSARPFPTVEAELAEMMRHREFFRKLLEPDPTASLGRLGSVSQVFEVRTVYPLLLGLLDRDLPQGVLDDILTDIESYIVRRAVCALTPKNYNRVFLTMLGKMPKGGLTRETFRSVLIEFQGDSSVWPTDETFREAWLTRPAYEDLGSGRVQLMLRTIENHLHTSKSELADFRSPLTVEHVLPQNWLEDWPLPSGRKGIPWFDRVTIARESDASEQAVAE